MAIRGMIFEIDGTLIDSNDAHAFVEAMAANGFPDVEIAKVCCLIGMGGDKLLPKPYEATRTARWARRSRPGERKSSRRVFSRISCRRQPRGTSSRGCKWTG